MTEGIRQDSAEGNNGKWGSKLETGSKSVFLIYSNSVEFSRDVRKSDRISHVCYMPRPYSSFDLHSLTGLSNGRRVFSVWYEVKLPIQRALTSVFKSEATPPTKDRARFRGSRSIVISLRQVSFNQG